MPRGGARRGAGRPRVLTQRVTRSVVFERAQLSALERMAKERGVSFSDLVRVSVSSYLKRQKGKS